jgi:hypothetical protein
LANCDEADPILPLAQCFNDRIDAIPDNAEDKLDLPTDQGLNEYIRGIKIGFRWWSDRARARVDGRFGIK